ncbi:bacteriocin [Streptococcus cuniculipharyngis]|uniref:Bacteriocin n=1 Tax=Streptococcus cuniculipharyngis TaxID=1562651 RepID=A0A5C5SCV5_9STRE|nr:bacteriocin [Streptococcus cuniculipharyngis]TWS98796.1 bacteriocin [Streptococcus cuniculipharyngis]
MDTKQTPTKFSKSTFSELSASELNHISGGNWWTIFLNSLHQNLIISLVAIGGQFFLIN